MTKLEEALREYENGQGQISVTRSAFYAGAATMAEIMGAGYAPLLQEIRGICIELAKSREALNKQLNESAHLLANARSAP